MPRIIRAYRSDADEREVNLIFDGPVTVTGNTENDAFVLPIAPGPVALPWFVPSFMEMRGTAHVVLRGEPIGLLPARFSAHGLSRWIEPAASGSIEPVADSALLDVESET